MTNRVAIVLGGAECWQRDLVDLGELLLYHRLLYHRLPGFYAVNDQIASFPGDVVACTLHPERLDEWVSQRLDAGLSSPRECWTRKHRSVSKLFYRANELEEWGGTSGLFAFQVARAHGHDRIIFCGVPMDESPNAFRAIDCAIARYTKHQDVWKRNMPAIKPFAKSMSGWTAAQLGRPTLEWLVGETNVQTITDHV